MLEIKQYFTRDCNFKTFLTTFLVQKQLVTLFGQTLHLPHLSDEALVRLAILTQLYYPSLIWPSKIDKDNSIDSIIIHSNQCHSLNTILNNTFFLLIKSVIFGCRLFYLLHKKLITVNLV